MRCNLNRRQRWTYVVTGAALAIAAWLTPLSPALRVPLAVLGIVIAIEGFAGY